MIETITRNYLDDNLSVSVYMEAPTVGTSFCVIERIGGSLVDSVNSCRIAIQSYAKTMLSAAQLNEEVKMVMSEFCKLPMIGSAKLVTDHNHTDTNKKRYRYQAVYDVYFIE